MNKQILLLSIGMGISLMSCFEKKQPENLEKLQVIYPLVKDTVYTDEFVASISAKQNVEVRSRIKGYIENIHVDEGQIVHKGQTLFSISSRVYQQELQKVQATVKSARAELKYAEIELENTKKLFDKNIISRAEYDLAAAKIEALKANLEEVQSDESQANLKLSFTEIKAPFDGIINRIPNKKGSLVEEGTLLTTISNADEVYAYFNVSEKEYLDLVIENEEQTTGKNKKREDVSLILANGELYEHKGIIETSESEFDPSTGNIAFRAKFPNIKRLLKHGGNGKIVIKKPLKKALLIPQKSTFEIQDKLYVYVVKSDSTVEQRNIVSNIRLPHLFVVETGLNQEEKIIYEGVQNVKEGDKISLELITFKQTEHSSL